MWAADSSANICFQYVDKEKQTSSYLSSVFNMMASRKRGYLLLLWQPKQSLFNKNSADVFTIRGLGANLVFVKSVVPLSVDETTTRRYNYTAAARKRNTALL